MAQGRVTDPRGSSVACENILHSTVMSTVRQARQGGLWLGQVFFPSSFKVKAFPGLAGCSGLEDIL